MDNSLRLQYLALMGIDVWLPRSAASLQMPGFEPEIAPDAPLENASPYAQLNWEALSRIPLNECGCIIADDCKTIKLDNSQQHIDWLIIVDAPVGNDNLTYDAEQLLTELLSAIGLIRTQVMMTKVYIDPQTKIANSETLEAANRTFFLLRQIELLQPKMILALGTVATQSLLKSNTGIEELRGIIHEISAISAVVTYNPAYLVHSTLSKRLVWQDLQLAMHTFNQKSQELV